MIQLFIFQHLGLFIIFLTKLTGSTWSVPANFPNLWARKEMKRYFALFWITRQNSFPFEIMAKVLIGENEKRFYIAVCFSNNYKFANL